MMIWGHRGCRNIENLDENTIEAFEWALEKGADGLEFDVQVSADGVPFVFHDETGHRLVLGADARSVQTLTWSEIKALRLHLGGRVPALDEMRQFAARTQMNLEIKTMEAVSGVIEFLRAETVNAWVVSSFLFDALTRVRTALPNLAIGYLLECREDETVTSCIERAVEEIRILSPGRVHLDNELASETRVMKFRQLGCEVHVWTVNDVSRGRQLGQYGVSGIFTDNTTLFRP